MTHAEPNWRGRSPEDGRLDGNAGLDDDRALDNSAAFDDSAALDDGAVFDTSAALDDETIVESIPAAEGSGHSRGVQSGAAGGGPGASEQAHLPLLEAGELEGLTVRWQQIQAGFVDEPSRAVQDADVLVADVMRRLAEILAAEREQLVSRLNAAGEDVSTEDLRQGLRRYRAFFERLLAA